ncbi:hypothetical protein BMS3Bbin03_01787 [bacterium BMS3Bbin03]|nr:hypothetical protein BMS3Bbin03_01787 [bacterium BMS3Bbin03]
MPVDESSGKEPRNPKSQTRNSKQTQIFKIQNKQLVISIFTKDRSFRKDSIGNWNLGFAFSVSLYPGGESFWWAIRRIVMKK